MPDITSLLETCTVLAVAAVVIVLAGGVAAWGRIWLYRHYRYDFDGYIKRNRRQMARKAHRWNREHARAEERGLQS